jgi:hypothetical protein
LFVDTEGARICETCKVIEVLLQARWVAMDEYLEQRRAAREGDVVGTL